MASPFDKSKEKKEEVNASSFSPSSAPEIKKAPVKEVELKEDEKMVQVELLTDLPSYNGKRYPKGRKLLIPKVAFNADLMKKI